MVVVLMGVTGSGKTTVGKVLEDRTQYALTPFPWLGNRLSTGSGWAVRVFEPHQRRIRILVVRHPRETELPDHGIASTHLLGK